MLWLASVCSDSTRSAPASLANAARSGSVGQVSSCRESIASIPVAVIRPTSRRARSHIEVGLGHTGDDDAAVGAAVPRVDHDPLAAQPRPGLAQQLLLAQESAGARR